jgi:hypothetical protein
MSISSLSHVAVYRSRYSLDMAKHNQTAACFRLYKPRQLLLHPPTSTDLSNPKVSARPRRMCDPLREDRLPLVSYGIPSTMN